MTKQEIFKKAHRMARSVHRDGDCYRATFSYALRLVIAGNVALNIKRRKGSMHIEYAADSVLRGAKHGESYVLESYADDESILGLVDEACSEKARAIAATIREIRDARRSHRKITSKQRYAIAQSLLEIFGTAPAVFAASYGVSEIQFMAQAGK